jgi:hypothetical protein
MQELAPSISSRTTTGAPDHVYAPAAIQTAVQVSSGYHQPFSDRHRVGLHHDSCQIRYVWHTGLVCAWKLCARPSTASTGSLGRRALLTRMGTYASQQCGTSNLQ